MYNICWYQTVMW